MDRREAAREEEGLDVPVPPRSAEGDGRDGRPPFPGARWPPRQRRPPLRLICIEQVHGAAGSSIYGAQQNLWAPATTGRDFDLSPTSLKPLEPFRDHITIVSNCDVPSADPTEAREIGGDHFRSSAAYLTQTYPKRTEGADVECGISMDQLLRAALRPGHADSVDAAVHRERRSVRRLRLRILVRLHRHDQLGVADQTAADDPRSARRLRSDVRRDRAADSPQERRERRQEDLSILDWVRESSKRLERRLGAADRVRLADYLDNVREIERRLQAVEKRNDSGEPRELPMAPRGIPDSFADHVKLMFDLQMLAFRSDVTRVFSFKLGRDGSNRVYKESGSTGAFHIVSHHAENPERVRELAKINAYHVSMLPYLLKQLKETPDGDGTMLDNSVVIYGSPMGNPEPAQSQARAVPASPATPAARSRAACTSRRRTGRRCRT